MVRIFILIICLGCGVAAEIAPLNAAPVEAAPPAAADEAQAPTASPDAVAPAAAMAEAGGEAAPPVVKPPVVFPEVVIANELVRVVISTQRGAIKRFELLDEKPVILPPALRARVGRHGRDVSHDEHVALLDNFYDFARTDLNLHNRLDFATESGANIDGTSDIPWTIVESGPDFATLRLEVPDKGLRVTMTYRMDAVRPTVAVELVLKNLGTSEMTLMPRLDPAFGGVMQDYPPAEQYYLCGFTHTGGVEKGSLSKMSLPKAGQTEIEAIDGVDFAGLKSRFFTAMWEPQWTALAVPKPEATGKEDTGGLSSGVAETEQIAGEPVKREGSVVLFTVQPNKDVQPMAALRIDLPSALVAAGADATYRWNITGSSMRKEALARLTDAEQRTEFTDGYYRFFKSLAKLLALFLNGIYLVVRNYGVALIVLTFLLKLALHRFTFKQQASMLKMQKLAPEMKALQERYKNDRAQVGAKTMELYKKHGVNPLSGCLPMFIQMPMFMALYQVFTHAADFRGSSFLWIKDLTLEDAIWGLDYPYLHWLTINPLALIYIGVTLWMSFQHKVPENADPQQAQMQKMMRYMPLLFGVIFYHMPAGLVLYFTVNAILSTIEIKMVKKKLGID